MRTAADPDWIEQEREMLLEGPHLKVSRLTVRSPARPRGVEWTVVHRPAAAVVAPLTPEGNFLLIRQERVAVRRTLWEFPAGQIEGAEENESAIQATARRELGEEAGVECPGALIELGLFFPSPGFTDECSHLFLAENVRPRAEGACPDESETILEVRAFSPSRLREEIGAGTICDANTLAAFARLSARGFLP